MVVIIVISREAKGTFNPAGSKLGSASKSKQVRRLHVDLQIQTPALQCVISMFFLNISKAFVLDIVFSLPTLCF